MADALAKRQFFVDIVPSETILNMDNPYDNWLRDALLKESGDTYMLDYAYYNGRYYCYFGIVPVLLLYLPWLLITENFLSDVYAAAILIVLLTFGIVALVYQLFSVYYPDASVGTFLASLLLFMLGSRICFAALYVQFYVVAILAAMMFAVWGVYFWLCFVERDYQSYRYLFLGSLLISLTAGCRPQFIVIAFVALFIFWKKRP